MPYLWYIIGTLIVSPLEGQYCVKDPCFIHVDVDILCESTNTYVKIDDITMRNTSHFMALYAYLGKDYDTCTLFAKLLCGPCNSSFIFITYFLTWRLRLLLQTRKHIRHNWRRLNANYIAFWRVISYISIIWWHIIG